MGARTDDRVRAGADRGTVWPNARGQLSVVEASSSIFLPSRSSGYRGGKEFSRRAARFQRTDQRQFAHPPVEYAVEAAVQLLTTLSDDELTRPIAIRTRSGNRNRTASGRDDVSRRQPLHVPSWPGGELHPAARWNGADITDYFTFCMLRGSPEAETDSASPCGSLPCDLLLAYCQSAEEKAQPFEVRPG